MSLSPEKVAFWGWTHDGTDLARSVAYWGWDQYADWVDVRIWWQA